MPNVTLEYVPGGRIITSKAAAAVVARELKAIQKDTGTIRPEDIVARAQSPRSPLHKYFEWDNTNAANAYRLNQARQLAREVEVFVIYGDDKPIKTRAFVSIVKDGGRSYETIKDVMTDKEWKAQLLSQALMDLKVWKNRYKTLTQLAEVFEAADRVLVRLSTPDVGKKRKKKA